MSLGQWISIINAHGKPDGPQPPGDDEFEAAIIRAREITDGSN